MYLDFKGGGRGIKEGFFLWFGLNVKNEASFIPFLERQFRNQSLLNDFLKIKTATGRSVG